MAVLSQTHLCLHLLRLPNSVCSLTSKESSQHKIPGLTEAVEKLGPLGTAAGKAKIVAVIGKTVWRLFKKLKIELLYDPGIHFWVSSQKELEAGS